MTPFLALAVGLAACGTQSGAATAPPRYTATVTVLEDKTHGPQMCMLVQTSMPPQCAGPDVMGWDWSKVRHESEGGTRWGLYALTGTWDGDRLTLTEPPREPEPRQEPREPAKLETPCPAPEGGWRPVNLARTTLEAMQKASERASTAEDFAGSWLDHLIEKQPKDGEDHSRDVVLNVAFTGDLAGREEWIREVWGGALCVSRAAYSEKELARVQEQVMKEKGVVSAGHRGNRVELIMWLATPEQRERLAARYGGALVVEDVLQPVR